MRSGYRENRIYCGPNYMDVQIYPVYDITPKGRSRRMKPTSEVQQRLNDDNAAKYLSRLIKTNFSGDDYALHLTYSDECLPENAQQAKRDVQNFFRRVKRYYSKSGIREIKYIWTTEQGGKKERLHHHIIISGGVDRDELEILWGKGYANSKRLQFDENGVEGLSHYIVKSPIFFRKWNCSKNLKKPVERSNDYRYNHSRARMLYESKDLHDRIDKLFIKKLYPGYELADMECVHNDVNNGYYFNFRLYKKAVVSWRKPTVRQRVANNLRC